VLYNDFVVSSLIKRFAAIDPNGFLLYLADHGEAVFDTPQPEVLGRNEGRPTSPMYTVPFIVWRSPQWRERHPREIAGVLGRPYSSEHFIHTWADLAGLRFAEFDASKSLINRDFLARPLLIGNPQQPQNLIDFSLIRPKPVDRKLAQKESARSSVQPL
jgi:heptose-I-phosphate ethanolaminephosphotransferase